MRMLAADLRAAVYQQAIEGKLTTHFQTDSSVMVKKRLKKKPLRKPLINITKEIKKASDDLSVPDYWRKYTLYDISISVSDGDHQPPPQTQEGIPFVVISNISEGVIDLSSTRHVPEEYFEGLSEDRKAENGDVLFSVTGSYGIVIAVKNQQSFCFQRHIVLIKADQQVINTEYLAIVLRSPYTKSLCDKVATGIAQKTVGIKTLQNIYIPLPPIEEQQRIVDRVNELMPLIDEYEAMEKRLAALKEAFPGNLRDAVLQAAMSGNLSEHLITDDSVVDLIENINTEREALTKNGSFKQNKKLKMNLDIPYEIPEYWEWVQIGTCTTYGQRTEKADWKNYTNDMWVLDLEDIEKCSGKIIKRQNLSQRRVEGERTVFHKDDILYSKLRPYLQKMLIADDEGICTPELIPFRTLGGVNREYILWFLRSPQVDYIINEASYGTKMPRVNTETMINLVVPLPPLAEQQRIVERLNTILPLCNELIEEI